jgi:putative type II/III system pilus formation protein
MERLMKKIILTVTIALTFATNAEAQIAGATRAARPPTDLTELQEERTGNRTAEINLYPGMATRIQIGKPYKAVVVGDPKLLDTLPGENDQSLIIQARPGKGGQTNVVVLADGGDAIATYLVTIRPQGDWSDERPRYYVMRTYDSKKGWVAYQCTAEDGCLPFPPAARDDSKATSTLITTTSEDGATVTKSYNREGPQ